MTKTIKAHEMTGHIERLSKCIALMEKPPHIRTTEDYGEVRGLLSYTRDALLRAAVANVEVETAP